MKYDNKYEIINKHRNKFQYYTVRIQLPNGKVVRSQLKRSLAVKFAHESPIKVRKNLLDDLIYQAKLVPFPFGIEVKKYKLTRPEYRYLADKGLHIHGPGRKRSFILIYPGELRRKDLREKVNEKRRKVSENKTRKKNNK